MPQEVHSVEKATRVVLERSGERSPEHFARVFPAMLELFDSVMESRPARPQVDLQSNLQDNNRDLLSVASRIPIGQPQQQVTALNQRIETLHDAIKIASARERSERRQHIRSQLAKTINRLDFLWKQAFKSGDNVLIKLKGDRNLPNRPARVISFTETTYTVVLKSSPSADNQKSRQEVVIERNRSSKTGRYLRIRSGVPPSKITANERKRLASAYALLIDNKLPGV